MSGTAARTCRPCGAPNRSIRVSTIARGAVHLIANGCESIADPNPGSSAGSLLTATQTLDGGGAPGGGGRWRLRLGGGGGGGEGGVDGGGGDGGSGAQWRPNLVIVAPGSSRRPCRTGSSCSSSSFPASQRGGVRPVERAADPDRLVGGERHVGVEVGALPVHGVIALRVELAQHRAPHRPGRSKSRRRRSRAIGGAHACSGCPRARSAAPRGAARVVPARCRAAFGV